MKKKRAKRPKKIPNVIARVQNAARNGLVRDTRHAEEQKLNRDITFQDIMDVLENGYHEKIRDEFKTEFQSWNYAIRGKTFEGRDLRVPIYFEGDLVMIVTAFSPGENQDD